MAFPDSIFAHPTGSFKVPVDAPDSDPDEGSFAFYRISDEWIPFVRGALSQLLLQSTWKGDPDAVQLAQQRAALILSMVSDMSSVGCDCISYDAGVLSRWVPDGTGGGSFVPFDPRTDGTVAAKWLPSNPGGTGNCLGAANIVASLKSNNDHMVALVDAEAEFTSVFAAVNTFVAIFIPVVGAIFALTLDLATLAIDTGATIIDAAFSGVDAELMYAELQCIIQCDINNDGSVTTGDIAAIKADFEAWLPGPYSAPEAEFVRIWIENQLDVFGPNGLTILSGSAGISTADCSSCDTCSWESDFDLVNFDYSSILSISFGHWENALGWVGDGAGGGIGNLSRIGLTFDTAADIHSMTVTYDTPDGYPASGGDLELYKNYFDAYAGLTPVAHGLSAFSHNENVSGATGFVVQLASGTPAATVVLKHFTIRGTGTKPANLP